MSDSRFTAKIHFSGRVQGVGFRYATLQVAREFEVVGQVKNLTDGRVELIAQGSENEVREFVGGVKERMEPFIREVDEKFSEAKSIYRSFEITH